MSLSRNLVGIRYRYPDHYVVEREKIREYAVAVKNDDPSFFEERPPPSSATTGCSRR
jgi:hypothetical protein